MKELFNNKKWVLCFITDKIPLRVSEQFLNNLPKDYATSDEFLEIDQWLAYTKSVTDSNVIKYSGDLLNSGCSEKFSKYWLDYNLANKLVRNFAYLFPVQAGSFALGYVLTTNEQYTVIDIDRKESDELDPELQQVYDYQNSWIEKLNSYTERSVSGKGFHVWVKGKIPSDLYPKGNGGVGSSGIRSSETSPNKLAKGIEIYCQDRYITFTNDTVTEYGETINDRQETLTELCKEIKRPFTIKSDDQKFQAPLDQEDIINGMNFVLCSITNSNLYSDFCDLFSNKCNYDYLNNSLKRVNNPSYTLSFPSQSEADMRFFSILVNFTDNVQIMKSLFSLSELGKRSKATRNDYLDGIINHVTTVQQDTTDEITLNETVEDTKPKKEEEYLLKQEQEYKQKLIDELINKEYVNKSANEINVNSKWSAEKTNPEYSILSLFADTLYSSGIIEVINNEQMSVSPKFLPFVSDKVISFKRMLDNGFINTNSFSIDKSNVYVVPPISSGLLYDLTKWSYKTRIKPVLEVSLTSALGILSGICGKMWQLPTKAGLNNYFILCAKSGIGKEGLHTTKDDLVQQLLRYNSQSYIKKFILNEDFVSGQSLIKYCAKEGAKYSVDACLSFCNYQKEFGKKLASMGDNIRDTNAQSLRGAFLTLYTGSAQHDVLNGMMYSNTENNVRETNAPAFSIVGETTTSGYGDAITPSMAQDGFLSRFITITYNGNSVPQNYDGLGIGLDKEVVQTLDDLCTFSANRSGIGLNATTNFTTVKLQEESIRYSNLVEEFVLEMLNSIEDKEHYRQAWNRCQLKILKLAGICAVGQNYMNPTISIQHIAWASRIVFSDIANMYKLIQNGDSNMVENLDSLVIDNIRRELRSFISDSNLERLCEMSNLSYQMVTKLKINKIVPFSYIYNKMRTCKAVLKNKKGYVKTLTEALQSMEFTGAVQHIEKASCTANFGVTCVCYKVSNL